MPSYNPDLLNKYIAPGIPEFTTWGARTARDYWYQSLSRGLVAGNAQMYRMARPYWFDTHTGSARARRV